MQGARKTLVHNKAFILKAYCCGRNEKQQISICYSGQREGGYIMMNVGQVISDLRREKELGQKELAALLNLSIGTISNYENGVHFPDLNTLCKIADFFQVTTDYLLGRTGYRCPPEALKEYIATDYLITDFINTVLSLDKNSQTAITKYADYLKYSQLKNMR